VKCKKYPKATNISGTPHTIWKTCARVKIATEQLVHRRILRAQLDDSIGQPVRATARQYLSPEPAFVFWRFHEMARPRYVCILHSPPAPAWSIPDFWPFSWLKQQLSARTRDSRTYMIETEAPIVSTSRRLKWERILLTMDSCIRMS
jgi:hypothetical protein